MGVSASDSWEVTASAPGPLCAASGLGEGEAPSPLIADSVGVGAGWALTVPMPAPPGAAASSSPASRAHEAGESPRAHSASAPTTASERFPYVIGCPLLNLTSS